MKNIALPPGRHRLVSHASQKFHGLPVTGLVILGDHNWFSVASNCFAEGIGCSQVNQLRQVRKTLVWSKPCTPDEHHKHWMQKGAHCGPQFPHCLILNMQHTCKY